MTEPFFHQRRLGDRRWPQNGLPRCPACPGRAIFEPTRKGQTHCLRHGGGGEFLSAAVQHPSPQVVGEPVQLRGRRRRA